MTSLVLSAGKRKTLGNKDQKTHQSDLRYDHVALLRRYLQFFDKSYKAKIAFGEAACKTNNVTMINSVFVFVFDDTEINGKELLRTIKWTLELTVRDMQLYGALSYLRPFPGSPVWRDRRRRPPTALQQMTLGPAHLWLRATDTYTHSQHRCPSAAK